MANFILRSRKQRSAHEAPIVQRDLGGDQPSAWSIVWACCCCAESPSFTTSFSNSRAPSLSPISSYALARSSLVATSCHRASGALPEPLPLPGVPRSRLMAPRSTEAALGASVFSSPDRKSTRLNSSHLVISYAVFCLKKNKIAQRL